MRCRQPAPIVRSPPTARVARCGSLCPDQLSDAAAQLVESLYLFATAIENGYYSRLRRYYASQREHDDSATGRQQQQPSTRTSAMTICRSDRQRHPGGPGGCHLLPPCTSMTIPRPACAATPLYSSPCTGPARTREPLPTRNYAQNAGFSADQIEALLPTRLRAPTPPDHRPTPQVFSGTAARSCARGPRPWRYAIATFPTPAAVDPPQVSVFHPSIAHQVSCLPRHLRELVPGGESP